eukprot:scaffold2734_cov350-Prasinococcus_capsulatus_cf.AAC.4
MDLKTLGVGSELGAAGVNPWSRAPAARESQANLALVGQQLRARHGGAVAAEAGEMRHCAMVTTSTTPAVVVTLPLRHRFGWRTAGGRSWAAPPQEASNTITALPKNSVGRREIRWQPASPDGSSCASGPSKSMLYDTRSRQRSSSCLSRHQSWSRRESLSGLVAEEASWLQSYHCSVPWVCKVRCKVCNWPNTCGLCLCVNSGHGHHSQAT